MVKELIKIPKNCGGKKCGSAFEWVGKPDIVKSPHVKVGNIIICKN